MPEQIPIPHAEINLFEKIPYSIQAVLKTTGEPVAGAIISGLSVSLDNPIGTLQMDPNDPTKGIFHPTKAGDCTLMARATVTIP